MCEEKSLLAPIASTGKARPNKTLGLVLFHNGLEEVCDQADHYSCLDSWWYCWSGGYYNLVRLVSFLSFFVENCFDAVESVWVAGVDPHLLGPESGSTAFDTSFAVLLGQTQACISNSEYSKLA